MDKKYLCIDVGGSSIKYAVLDEKLNFLFRGNAVTPYEGVERYLDVLEEIYHTAEAAVTGIVGIAMSVPGVIDSHNGICINGGSLLYIELFPLVARMEERCHVPVSIMNDAKSAALAEVTWGSLSDCQDAIVLVFGTGIGGALVKDGEVHLGKHFAAGEFSWLMMSQEFDHVEDAWCYRNGFRRLVSMAAKVKGVDPESINGMDVFRWAEEGDEGVLWVLDKFTKDIAYMIMNLQCVYDPERFAIGGGISKQPLLLKYIQKNLNGFHTATPFPIPKPEVTVCKYYNDANLIGALGYFLSQHTL
ncbi:MAG: ROK family protein [Eubacteriales bacterium]|nr:ROK family protein [Eubacteriales bacterium]